ncbi:MAG: response regulator [Thermodesulfovibrionales bacterium]|nr:response regulator [Thermodesulfovibrionales bacterium]
MKIMVVDDCKTTRKLLSMYLKSRGFEVVTAENGLDAIEKLASHDVNLIMSDLNMPFMDGIELVKNLKNNPTTSHIPILMVTTEADPEEKQKAMEAGASAYLVKPVTAEVVASNIKEILKNIFKKGGADA